MSTMVNLCVTSAPDSAEWRQGYYQPWEIDRVEAWTVQGIRGTRLTLSSGGDDAPEYVYTLTMSTQVVQRIDAAQAAINGQPADGQPVRVTNWMSQVWVLLLVNCVVNLVLSRWMQNVGHCLFEYTCDYPYWWLP